VLGPLKLTPSLVMTVGLVVLGVAASATSLSLQGAHGRSEARAVAAALTGGDAERGKRAIQQGGCGACHEIPGVDRADGQVGPSLKKIAVRAFLAGDQPNDPAHMIQWVQHAQAIRPGSGMPDIPMTDQRARDIAAYLYTLKS
jgi:cytochrome c